MDGEEKLRRTMRAREAEEEAREQRWLDVSKARLLRIVRKKFKTANIGDIARVEEWFGSLWGHGKPEGERSEAELEWAKVWRACRTEMLNLGNAQSRAVEAEFATHEIRWLRHRLDLPVVGSQETSKDEGEEDDVEG